MTAESGRTSPPGPTASQPWPTASSSGLTAPSAWPATADPAEARRRGKLVIAEKVFEKLAGQAASEIASSRGRTGGFLGIGAESDADARPKVGVTLSSDSVDLDLAVGVAYPGSIRAAAQQIRDHVTRTVVAATGVPVHRVDIDITFFTVTDGTEQRKQALR